MRVCVCVSETAHAGSKLDLKFTFTRIPIEVNTHGVSLAEDELNER